MMINLFSSFDPSTFIYSFNWFSSILIFFFLFYFYWLIPSRFNFMSLMLTKIIHSEFFILIKNPANMGMTLIFISIMFFVIMNNFFGLFPYIFTSTSHLILTLSLSLPLWLSFMIYGWLFKTNHMFSHLVPLGTPFPLMPFMVCIETISNVIRPGTLAVRLSANMIAGHLILTLLGNTGSSFSLYLMPILVIIQIALLTLETAVAFIQSYVISILLTLYSSEVN
uniref:ATP synthase subunit a n=1 Tax=Dorypteryx domestica TaxID=209979 RepID=A0A343QC99_9NEOP|nr:ATP synthase F0 subunit 6 [Dorypteryx domestica]ATU07046.1 ATP synthase F0 subunit 6 [Dorypteryx domestica]